MEAKPPPPQEGNPQPPAPRRKWKLPRWVIWVAGGLFALILIFCLSFTSIVTAIIRHELQAEIAGNLNATLEIDTLSYLPFLSVNIGHAELSMPGPDGSPVPVAELGGLQVSLAKLPLGGPILVRNFALRDPRIDLVELPSGELQIEENFLKPSTTPSSPMGKLSDLLQVGHFEIDNLQVRLSDWKSTSPPKVLGTLDVSADQTAAGVYNFHVAIADKPLAELGLDGSVDVDGTSLAFKNFSATAQVPQASDLATLPPALQEIFKQYGLAGCGVTLSVADGGNVAIDLTNNRWRIQNLSGGVKVTSQPPGQVASGEFDWKLSGGGPLPGGGVPLGPQYLAALDADTYFSLSNPSDAKFNLNTPQLGHPLSDVAIAIEFSNRTLKVKEFSARYDQYAVRLQTTAAIQGNQLKLDQCRLDIAGDKPLVQIALDGSANLDETGFSIQDFSVMTQIPQAGDLASLPPQLQSLCQQYNLAGTGVALTIPGGASLAIDPAKNHWRINDLSGELKVTSQAPAQLASGTLDWKLTAGGPLPRVDALGPEYLGDLDDDSYFSLSNPADSKFSLHSPQLDEPLTDVRTSIEFSKRKLTVNEFNAHYGSQEMNVQTIAEFAPNQLKLERLHLSLANDKAVTELGLDGSLELDGSTLTFKKFAATAQIPQESELASLPESVRSVCEQYGLAGSGVSLSVNDGGSVAIDPAKNRWRIENLAGQLVLSAQAPTTLASGTFNWKLAGGGPLPTSGAPLGPQYLAMLDADTSFSLSNPTNSNLNVHWPQLGQPLTDVATDIEFSNRTLTIKEFSGHFGRYAIHVQTSASIGGNQLKLDQCKVEVSGDNKPLLEVTLDGTADLNESALSLKEFSAMAQIPQQSDLNSLPPQLQSLCTQYGLAGTGIALAAPGGTTVTIDRAKNRWRINHLDGELTLTSQPPGQLASGKIDWKLTGGGPLPAPNATLGPELLAGLDPDTDLLLSIPPDGRLSVRSPQLQQPLNSLTMSVEFSNRTLTVKNFSGHYGNQAVYLQTSAVILPNQLKLQQFEMDLANGGVIINSAAMDLNPPHHYTIQILVEHVDLRDVKQFIPIDDPQGRMSGLADAKVNLSGTMPDGTSPLASATGDGNFHVTNGDFLDIKVLSGIVGIIDPGAQGVGRVGDAAGVFTIGGGSLQFSQLAVNCPILGIQGQGTVGLLGANLVDLSLIVAPFGDWQKSVQNANSSGIAQFFGHVVGTAQKVIGTVTQKAVLSFHVTGPAENPSIKPVPVPALTKGANDLFGKMANGVNGAKGNLLDLIQPQKDSK